MSIFVVLALVGTPSRRLNLMHSLSSIPMIMIMKHSLSSIPMMMTLPAIMTGNKK
jgi:hypothetical protein